MRELPASPAEPTPRKNAWGRQLSCLIVASWLGGGVAHAAALAPEAAQRQAQASYREYFELLAMPNDAVVPADIRRNVDWLEQAFRKRGFTTRQLANDGKPMLYAEFPGKNPARKTVLFYMHLDGQPVIASQWAQKSPWTPVLKRKAANGEWEEIDAARCPPGRLIRNGGYSAVRRQMTRDRS